MRANMTNRNSTKTVNHEGGTAFKQTAEMALYLATCATFLEDSYYEKGTDRIERLRQLIKACDNDFVLRLAAFARNEMNLRSVSILLLVEAAINGASVRRFVPQIVRRADELAETLARFQLSSGNENVRKIPASLKRGLSDAFNSFNEYNFGKYKGEKRSVSLKDAVCLVHPKPANDERAKLYKRILDDKLAIPETWETYISANGSSAETWDKIAPSMGVFAVLRNLRNFEQHNAQKAIEFACEMLRDPKVIHNSKLLPFRFMAADREITSPVLHDAVRYALNLSVENIPKLDGMTFIWADTSGSMSSPVSGNSKMSCADVAATLAAMVKHVSSPQSLVGAFATDCQVVQGISSMDSILTNAERVRQTRCGGGTNGFKTIKYMNDRNIKADRIVILSDMQMYDDAGYYGESTLAKEWQAYRKSVNPEAMLFSVDLRGYSTSQFSVGTNGVVMLSGFSDRILSLMESIEKYAGVIDKISTYEAPAKVAFNKAEAEAN